MWDSLPIIELRALGVDENGVQVLSCSLDRPTNTVASLHAILSTDERERARSYLFEKDRRRYIVRRGVLRTILGMYLRTNPATICFEYGAHGKPLLAREENPCLRFSLSHSDGLALYAFSRTTALGVDIEAIRFISDIGSLVKDFFSSSEHAAYRALPAEQRVEAFFRCWTRKEAYIKATGEGLSLPLTSIAVSLDDRALLCSIAGDPLSARRWSLHHLQPAPRWVGAVAIQGPAQGVSCAHLDIGSP